MRHRDRETVAEALEDWRDLRKKVATEGGDNYARPVLVKFLDSGTFEVMERDIVEDVFYVLREYKILRELAPDGRDLDAAIREAGRDSRGKGQSQQRNQPRDQSRRQGGKPGEKPAAKPGEKRGERRGDRRGPRRGRRRGRRTGRKPGQGPGQSGPKPE